MTFRSEGVDCAARIYRPDIAPGETTPCVVMANGFSLTRGERRYFAQHVGQTAGSHSGCGAPRLHSLVQPARGAPRFRRHSWRSLPLAQRVLATSFAGATSFRPVRVAHRVQCPLFVAIGEQDHVVPRWAAERTVESASRGERRDYPIDHSWVGISRVWWQTRSSFSHATCCCCLPGRLLRKRGVVRWVNTSGTRVLRLHLRCCRHEPPLDSGLHRTPDTPHDFMPRQTVLCVARRAAPVRRQERA